MGVHGSISRTTLQVKEQVGILRFGEKESPGVKEKIRRLEKLGVAPGSRINQKCDSVPTTDWRGRDSAANHRDHEP
jgi:hypothetical protein